jgi:3',5'-cyclic AMP phosphodiesterase CpdA
MIIDNFRVSNRPKSFKIFGRHFSEVFERTYCPNGRYFPYAKELDDVVIIGINSIDQYSKLKNPFAANGKISKKESAGLKEIFSISEYRDKTKIVLVHHHFNKIECENSNNPIWNRIEAQTMKLRGKKKIINLFEDNNVSLVLHGHVHTISDYRKNNIRFLNAGASLEGGDSKYLKYNEIEISNGIITTEAHSIPVDKSPVYILNRKAYQV